MTALQLLAAAAAGMATVGCEQTSDTLPQSAGPTPFLAMRLAFHDSAAGRERVQHGDTTIFLAPEVLLADEDILGASTVNGPDGLLLHIRHRPSERLMTATAAHVGTRLALLLESRVRGVAPIAAPIGAGGSITINTGATGEDAERIALQVRSRWPAR